MGTHPEWPSSLSASPWDRGQVTRHLGRMKWRLGFLLCPLLSFPCMGTVVMSLFRGAADTRGAPARHCCPWTWFKCTRSVDGLILPPDSPAEPQGHWHTVPRRNWSDQRVYVRSRWDGAKPAFYQQRSKLSIPGRPFFGGSFRFNDTTHHWSQHR